MKIRNKLGLLFPLVITGLLVGCTSEKEYIEIDTTENLVQDDNSNETENLDYEVVDFLISNGSDNYLSYDVVVNSSKTKDELIELGKNLKQEAEENGMFHDEYLFNFYAKNELSYNRFNTVHDITNRLTISSDNEINDYEVYGVSLDNLPSKKDFLIATEYYGRMVREEVADYDELYSVTIQGYLDNYNEEITVDEIKESVLKVTEYFTARDLKYETKTLERIQYFEAK